MITFLIVNFLSYNERIKLRIVAVKVTINIELLKFSHIKTEKNI